MNRAAAPRLRLVGAAAFWGGAFVAGRIALAHLTPLTAAFWRFALGLAVLGPVWARLEGPAALPRRPRAWVGLAAVGFTGIFAYNWLFFRGLATTEAGAAALVITTNPALTALLAAVLLRERLSPGRVGGFALAAAGALVVLSGGAWARFAALDLGPGAVDLGLAVLCWVAYTLLGRLLLRGLSPLTVTTAAFAFGVPLLAAGALTEAPLATVLDAPAEVWAALGFLGACSSALGFLWYFRGVQELGAGRASVFIYLVPGFALLGARVLLGEPVSGAKLFGGLLVIAGVALTAGPRPGGPASAGKRRPPLDQGPEQ